MIDTEIFGNRIIILKKVKSLKQLRRTEKELVKLNYKVVIIKGFTLKGIEPYILLPRPRSGRNGPV